MAGPDILAAGGIVWRRVDGVDVVGLVARPRYGGDVSLPKGKLERGETLRECALREVAEELGITARLGPFAGAMTYPAGDRDKYVLLWEMDHVAELDDGPDGREITGRLWLPPDEAVAALTYRLERDVVAAVLSRRRS